MLKIQKLEKLCRALQEERAVLYAKIQEVRKAGSAQAPPPGSAVPLTPTEAQELQEDDPVLTEDMSRLRQEQAKLQEFAASLFAIEEDEQHGEDEEASLDAEEDQVSSAFIQFKSRTQTAARSDCVPEQAESPPAEVKGQSRDHQVAREPPAEAEPTPDAEDLEPEERQEEEATEAPPPDAAATEASKKQTSKKKKKRNTQIVS